MNILSVVGMSRGAELVLFWILPAVVILAVITLLIRILKAVKTKG